METLYENQLISRGQETDLMDATIIYEMLKLSTKMEGHRKGVLNRFDRETIQKIWQEPRMSSNKLTHNKDYRIPWTPKAKQHLKDGTVKNNLVLEHTVEMKTIVKLIKKEILENRVNSPETMLMFLNEIHKGFSFIVVSREDDALITKGNDLKNTDVWKFYNEVCGFTKQECTSPIEDRLVADILDKDEIRL